jgi:hypothetical protein
VICFSLICADGHEFDGWFRNNADFERQAQRGLIDCAVCGSNKVSKALMAPAIAKGKKEGREPMALSPGDDIRQTMLRLRKLVDTLKENAEYVGERFAEEARRIHFEEVEPRGIYGEATPEEARSLIEDGIDVMPLPVFPDDRN